MTSTALIAEPEAIEVERHTSQDGTLRAAGRIIGLLPDMPYSVFWHRRKQFYFAVQDEHVASAEDCDHIGKTRTLPATLETDEPGG